MGDILLALSIPVIVCASGIYAAAEAWWLRRHPRQRAITCLCQARRADGEALNTPTNPAGRP